MLRVGAAYVVFAWLTIQVVETIFPAFGFGNAAVRITTIAFAIGLIPVVIFAWAFELTPEGLKKESDVDRSQSIAGETGKKLDRVIMLVLALALSYFAFDKFVLVPEREAELVESAIFANVEKVPEQSIAVLPFVNMSSDPEQEYFSDGISEEILNVLAKVDDLRVAGRTSSFAFKGRNEDLREIGNLLNVAHVLEGSVRKSGNTIRITAQLIKVEDGYHLWSETWDRELTDVFAIQDEIAGNVLEAIEPRLLGDSIDDLKSTETDLEVYELYLQARALIRKREQQSLEQARDLLERAIDIEDTYAPALAQLALTIRMLTVGAFGSIPPELVEQRVRDLTERAITLDPGHPDSWLALGYDRLMGAHKWEGRINEAVQAFEKAYSINPSSTQVLHMLARAYGHAKDRDREISMREHILDIDPLYAPNIFRLTRDYNRLGRQSDSHALFERLSPFLSDHPRFKQAVGYTHIFSGEWASAIKVLEPALEEEPNNRVTWELLAFSYNSTHQFEKAIAIDKGHFAGIALWNLGQLEESLEILVEPAEDRYYTQPYYLVLNSSDRSGELIDSFFQTWGDLETYVSIYEMAGDMSQFAPLNELALAFRKTGDSENERLALELFRVGNDELGAAGWNNYQFHINEAVHQVLVGDTGSALQHLEAAFDWGFVGPTRFASLWSVFRPLEGNERYVELQDQMIEHLNSERAKLGLEPVLP